MNTSIEIKEIAKTAWELKDTHTEDDLQAMLVEEWSIAEESEMSTRGELSDYLKGVVKQIANGIVRNKDLTVATMGLITSDVVSFMITNGYDDLAKYRLAIAVLASLVAKALIDHLEVVLDEE